MNDNDKKVLDEHLQSLTEDDLSEDDGYEASNGSQALEQVRKVFYGTPFEKLLTDAIIVCDALHKRCEEVSNG